MSFEIKINNEKEWKEVNINGLSYVISNYGDVVTLSNRSHKIVPHLNKDGYPIVTVGKNPRVGKPIHLLVAMLFVDGYKDGYEVNHKDFDRTNYHYSNLEWVSHKDNINYSYKNGRHTKRINSLYGNNRKLKKEAFLDILNKLENGMPCCDIAIYYGVSVDVVYNIKSGKTYKEYR